MPAERVQLVVFEINTSANLHQIAFVIMLQSKFFKDNKMGNCNFENFCNFWKKYILKKLPSAYLHQITIEINSSPINNLHE